MELTLIFVGIRPDENDPKPAKNYDDLVNGARELIARRYGQVGDYDHVQTVRELSLVGNLEVPEAVWDDVKRGSLELRGHGVVLEAEAP
jgi:hypothetical protein